MYLARYETPDGSFLVGGVQLDPPGAGPAAAVYADVVGAAADALECCPELCVGVVRAPAGRTCLLVAARQREELLLRGTLLGWHALNEAIPGMCTLLDSPQFDEAVGPAGPGVYIHNLAEERDGVRFFPAYRIADRPPDLLRRLALQDPQLRVCWCLQPFDPAAAELLVRLNLARLGREWIPERARAAQEALAERFFAARLLASEYVLVSDAAAGDAVLASLEADAAAVAGRDGFTSSVCAAADQLDPALLVLAQFLPPPAEQPVSPGNAAPPGFLKRVLLLPPARAARPAPRSSPPLRPVQAFLSYAHEDREYAERLKVALAQLERDGYIRLWSDAEIVPGQEWLPEISLALESAELVILLVSPDFMASEFCWSVELERALQRHAGGGTAVLPVHIRRADVTNAPFDALQSLPSAKRPVSAWPDPDEAWYDVATGIRRLLQLRSTQPLVTGGPHA